MTATEFLQQIHDSLDDYNSKNGDECRLCCFCLSNVYDSKDGIVHDVGCIIYKLRVYILQHDWKTCK